MVRSETEYYCHLGAITAICEDISRSFRTINFVLYNMMIGHSGIQARQEII